MPATTPARISAAVRAGVEAVRSENRDDFDAALTELNALEQSRLSLVLAGIIRHLLEILHPDGLDGDDVQDALTQVARAGGWYPGLQPEAIGEVLLGSLGVLAPEDTKTAGGFVAHAVLLIGVLSARQPRPVTALIATELAEIERAETMELP